MPTGLEPRVDPTRTDRHIAEAEAEAAAMMAAGDPDRWIEPDDRRFRPRSASRFDVGLLAACALGALALAWLVAFKIGSFSMAGFLAAWYVLFLVVTTVAVRELDGWTAAKDRLMNLIAWSAAVALLTPVIHIVGYVVIKGVAGLRLSFFTQDLRFVGALNGNAGGALHAIVGTIEQVGIAILLSVPLAILCAVFLNEVGGPLRRPVRIFVDAMSGVPTIVAGLFIFAMWDVGLGQGFSGFAAALAISVTMLPTVTRTSEEVLRLVPGGLREASFALGAPEWRTVRGVVLPTARAGLATAVILGVARGIGETAPLIMTSLGSQVMNANPFSGAQDSLPLFVYRQYGVSIPAVQQRAWTGALVLLVLILALFVTARWLGSRTAKSGRLGKAPERLK